jgi:hypothetical protein
MHMYVCIPMVLDPSTMYDDPYDGMRSMLLEALPKVSLMRKQLATVPLDNGGRAACNHWPEAGSAVGTPGDPLKHPPRGHRPTIEPDLVDRNPPALSIPLVGYRQDRIDPDRRRPGQSHSPRLGLEFPHC